MSGRNKSRWAALVAGALVLMGLGVATPAHADAQPGIAYPAGFGNSSFERTYGAESPAARRIEIGTATRTLLLDPGFGVFGSSMQCSLETPTGGIISGRTWHEEEWEVTDDRRLPVPEGRVVPGGLYEVWCESGDFTSARIRWMLSVVEGGTVTLPLSPDAAKAVVEHETVFLNGGQNEQRTLTAGDRVTITGSPGTWARQGEIDAATVAVTSAGSARVETEPEISNDRSALTFVIPDEATTSTLAGRIELQVRVDSTLAGSDTVPAQSYSAWWIADATLVDQKASSTVRLALSGEYAVSVRRVTGTARVIVPGTPHPRGTATVVVDGVVVRTLQLAESGSGRVTFTLPLLKRGTHEVHVLYSGTDTIRGGTSPSASVRVIL